MAVALDLDELDARWQYGLAGGDLKKWKWASPDRAGTLPLGVKGESEEAVKKRQSRIMENAARFFSGGKKKAQEMPKAGDVKKFFERSRFKKVKKLEYPDGRVEFRDQNDNVVKMPEDHGFFISEEVDASS